MAEYLYVICRRDGVRKLGRSRDPHQRYAQLCREIPEEHVVGLALEYQVECPAEHVAKAEAHAHSLVSEWRYLGEWFQIDGDTARQAVDAAAALAVEGGEFPKVKIERLNILIDPALRKAIKKWRHQHFIDTEGEAIRQLLRLALDA